MALIVWSEEFSVKVPTLDADHRKLVEMINTLHDAMKSGKGKDVLERIISDATNYTLQHFANEEKLMVQCNYSGYQEHKKIHEEFIQKIAELKKQYDSRQLQSSAMLSTLQTWLLTHIVNIDKQYSPALSKGQ
jgi:hemerythrin